MILSTASLPLAVFWKQFSFHIIPETLGAFSAVMSYILELYKLMFYLLTLLTEG